MLTWLLPTQPSSVGQTPFGRCGPILAKMVVANQLQSKVEAPITDHLKEFVPDSEKYKAVQIISCREIKIRIIATFMVILSQKFT